MEIFRVGARPSRAANSDYFTGTVWQDPVVQAPEPARVQAVRVSFEPSARTAWHSHPLGQTLHVLSGVGLVGLKGSAPQLIWPGDTIWIPPQEVHWHGATPDGLMVHLAIHEALNGQVADWLEHVSDADYLQKPE